MIKKLVTPLLLGGLLCFGTAGFAWAQICSANETPVCKKIGESSATLNNDQTKCIYTPICSSTGKPPVNGTCADVLVCPTGTTGTPPNNCQTSERACPSNSSELPDGTCSAAPPLDGHYECPTPSVWDDAAQKCLFDVSVDGSETISEPFCSDGYYKVGDHCEKRNACSGTNIWSDPCIYRPDPGAICNQADVDTPL